MTDLTAKNIWQTVLGDLQIQITRPTYETWLKDTIGLESKDNTLTVGTPNIFVAEMLQNRMYPLISETTQRIASTNIDLKFVVVGKNSTTKPSRQAKNIKKENKENVFTPLLPLNDRYTFSSFVVGESNELAYHAALAVSENPGVLYNPLFIYSEVGLGKTHLLHSIGTASNIKKASSLYLTSEEYTNQFISSIKNGKTSEFRDNLRKSDVILIDDIQFLIGKEQTQEAFFHMFNYLHLLNKQIVIASDRPVSELHQLEKRIQSRLKSGLIVDIKKPELETKAAILSSKLEATGFYINPSIISFLAEQKFKSIRDIEGALTRLTAYAKISKKELTLDKARDLSSEFTSQTKKIFSAEDILSLVAKHLKIDESEIESTNRAKSIALGRMITIHLLSEKTNLGPTDIGRKLGGRSHSTVIKILNNSIKKMQEDINYNKTISTLLSA
ncbi:MAG: chromosomal replication initiator protein DnaA [Chloroflexi bacterium]|nr:chromosomal replication initiator protein DnaA [Chloroflexota bacterium]|tara:strand:- start:42667 stop:43998 length:1332 start_codon:yes stop_codon:yes gene_type:complete